MSDSESGETGESGESGESAQRTRTRRRLTFAAGILIFLIGVTVTIVTPDNVILGLTTLSIGVILVALPGRRSDTRTKAHADTGPDAHEKAQER
ncbi:MAG: hypothetical protein RJQ01_00760 [Microcella sp.]|uniref:hypothetical protein n=1 Tax=Microcella sp. TaxID=1913979 RepID=UPI00331600B2